MADVDKVSQIQNALLGSFETYYKEMVKKNQYDITVDATVIDVSKKPDGIYRVRTTGAEFEAFATAGSYYKNDIVLVQIPNGDYKNPKFILGRKSDIEENRDFNLKFPFDDFIGLMHLDGLICSEKDKMHWANWPETPEAQNELLYTRVWRWTNTDGATIGNTRLGIEVDWQTFLAQYHPLRGTFGFRIIVQGNSSSTEVSDATSIEREYYFTNADMYGNPYAYKTPYTQQKVLDVSEFLKISDISIYFYQDFNFADNMNKPIQYEEKGANGPFVPQNILFNNLKVYLGVSAEDRKEESTYLYSYDALSYSSEEKVYYDENNNAATSEFICNDQKLVFFTWVHYESDGTFSVIKDATDLAAQRNKAGKKTHIYWYRYNYDEDITDEERIWDSAHADLAKDWNDSLNNSNYESAIERYGGAHWTFLPYATDDFAIEFTPRGDKSREKFKVVVQHDGSHTTSDELIFKNTRDIEAEILSGAKNDTVVIKTFKLKKVKDNNNRWTGNYKAVEDGSINAFYIYDENNKILMNDDDERFDEHYYYLQVQVRNEVTNKYEILTTVSPIMDLVNGKEQIIGSMDTGSTLAWALPREYTMIATASVVDTDDAKKFGIDPDNELVRYQNFCNATIKFKVASIYNNRYLNNTIGAIITQNGKNHHVEKHLMFGRAEGLGHEYLPVIEIIQPVGDTYLHADTDFIIGCCVYNKDGTLYESPNLLTMTWRELSGKAKFHHFANINGEKTEISGYQIGAYTGHYDKDETYLYADKYTGYRSCCVSGTLEVDPETGFAYPPIFEVTVNGAASYPLVVRKGFMVCSDYSYKQEHNITVPARVEFKSDGADPIFYSDYFEVAKKVKQEGTNLVDYDLDFPEWQINNNNIFDLKSITTERKFIERDQDGNIITADRGYTRYKLVFKGGEDAHPQWLDEYLDEENYTYLYYNKEYTSGDSTNTIQLAQAIAFDRNYYASSLVNDWDGVSLTWDEENGAILSTMIAAGAKDNNNKFTGVMMGDWHAKGDESLDTPGLYGYNKGAQVFGFKTDGTGFIGASGKGRIEFDGTEALISNHNRSCYINLNPVNLNDRLYKSNNSSFSQNFIYCKVKKTDNDFSSISNAISGEKSWSKEYFKDTEHDYFIVDPNYGVLTTGGVVAKYGALGNWMISNQGMYQKKLLNEEANKGNYMYLGFEETDTSYARTWADKKANLVKAQSTCETLFSDLDKQSQDKTATETLKEDKESTKDADIAAIDKEIEKLKQEKNDATAEYSNLNDKIEYLNEEISKIEDEQIPEKQKQLQDNIKAIDKKYESIHGYEESIERQNQIIADSQDEYGQQLIMIRGQINQLKDIRNNNENNNALIKEYESQYNELITDKNTYTESLALAKLNVDSLLAEYEALSKKVTAAKTELDNLNYEVQSRRGQIWSIEQDIKTIAREAGISEEILDSAAYQLEIDSLKQNIDEYDNIINNEDSTEEEISTAKSQKEIAIQQKEAYESILNFAYEKDELLEEINGFQNSINEKQSILDDQLIPAQASAQDNYEQALDEKQQYENDLSITDIDFDILKANVNKLSDAFDWIYNDIVDLHSDLGETDITLSKEELTDEDLYAEGEPNSYPANENTKESISAYIEFEFVIQKKKYAYLVYKIGNGYENIEGKIQGSIETLLNDRETKISEIANKNQTILDANNLIASYKAEINKLNKEISNEIPGEAPGLKQLNVSIIQDIDDLQAKINKYKSCLDNKKKSLIEQEAIIAKNTNLIASKNNDREAITNEIERLSAYLETIEENIGKIKVQIANQTSIINTIQSDLETEILESDIEIDFKKDTLNIDSNLNHIKNIIKNTINAINNIITNQSIKYAVYISHTEPTPELKVMPYFSVDWTGSMFARRGKIANTWNIDDYALTYKKNNDILYLGTESYQLSGMKDEPELDPENPDLYPLGRAVSLEDPRRWAISASSNYNNATSPYLINFGVSTAGELFAQFGHIAGWEITSDHIKSPPSTENGSYLILDSKKNIIQTSDEGFMIEGSTGTLKLNAGYGDSANSNVGLLYLAKYLLAGRTINEVLQYSDLKKGEKKENPRTIGGTSDDYGWGSVSVGGTSITTSSNKWITDLNFALDANRSNYLHFLDTEKSHEIDDGVNPGVVLVTGKKQNSEDMATIFYPVQDGGILGLQGHKWNLVAENIDASLINAGGINGEEMYEKFERLATQVWVTDALAKLWNALSEVSTKAGQAMKSGKAQTVTKVEVTGSITRSSNFNLDIGITVRKGNGQSLTDHITGGISLAHSHSLEGSFSEGTFTCIIGGVNFNKTNRYTYNVANSGWFRAKAYARMELNRNKENSSVTAYALDGRELGTINVGAIYRAGHADGVEDAKCNRYHEGAQKGDYELMWVRT